MKVLATALTAIVSLLHFAFMILEMFFWDHPVGRKIFQMTEVESGISAPLAVNMGLYNGFLAAGLVWGMLAKKHDVIVFFLLCVIVAGVVGAATAKPSILFTQALPAALALGATLAAKRAS